MASPQKEPVIVISFTPDTFYTPAHFQLHPRETSWGSTSMYANACCLYVALTAEEWLLRVFHTVMCHVCLRMRRSVAEALITVRLKPRVGIYVALPLSLSLWSANWRGESPAYHCDSNGLEKHKSSPQWHALAKRSVIPLSLQPAKWVKPMVSEIWQFIAQCKDPY